MKTILDPELCWRVLLTLGHFLWQGVLIALIAAAVAWLLRRTSARARYGVWVVALLLMTLCPVATFVHLSLMVEEPPVLAATPEQASVPPFAPSHEPPAVQAPVPVEAPAVVTAASVAAASREGGDWKRYAPHMTTCYLLGVALMFGRLLLALNGATRLRRVSEAVTDPAILKMIARGSRAMRLRCVPTVAFCRQVAVPTVVGLLRPVILLPVAFGSGLSQGQVEAILIHELEHIRRHDFLVNLFQRVAEAVLFFHPAVWLVSRRIRIEREHCCDDAVVAAGCEPMSYAESLVAVAEQALATRAGRCTAAAAALYAHGGSDDLRGRVSRMLRIPAVGEIRLRVWPLALMVVLAVSSVAIWAATKGPEPPPKQRIGIYLVTGVPEDVRFDEAPLADLTLAAELLISQDDIYQYDWESHTIRLKTQAAADRVLRPTSSKVPAENYGGAFVLVVDGQRLYSGQKVWVGTSHLADVPVIHTGPTAGQFQPAFAIRIFPPTRGNPDPRGNPRLKKALQDLLLMPKDDAKPADPPGGKLEFRIAPKPEELKEAELARYLDWLKAGRVGPWWLHEKEWSGQVPPYIWVAISSELTNAAQLVTGEYQGKKYVLVSDRPGRVMVPGEGKDAWGFEKVFATQDSNGRPAVGFELDDRGTELFNALTKANIDNTLAVVIDDQVVSAPVIRSALGKHGMITGRFTEERANELIKALQAGMPAAPPLTMSFDPVIERVVSKEIDLDTGSLNPEGLKGSGHRADALYEDPVFVFSASTPLIRLTADDWDGMSPAHLKAVLEEGGRPLDSNFNRNATRLPMTLGFLTGSDRMGILQIIDLTESPRGVKIRYKLVRATESTTPPAIAASEPMTPEERQLVGIWRRLDTAYNDDGEKGTSLMILNADRTWVDVAYPGDRDIPKSFWSKLIVRGPRWTLRADLLRRYHPPPQGGGEHTYDGKIQSISPTTLAFKNTRKPELGPIVYTRVTGNTEVEIRGLLEHKSPSSKLEFRIAPSAAALAALDQTEMVNNMNWLKAGRVGFWWKGGRIAGRMPTHAWVPLAGELSNSGQLVTGEYEGQKYVLVSDNPGQIMLPGRGPGAWGLAKVFATTDHAGQPSIGFVLDDRGAERFAAFTKANVGNALAILVDGKVVSAPMLMSALGKQGMITGHFSDGEVKELIKALQAGMPATPPSDEVDKPKQGLFKVDVELETMQNVVSQFLQQKYGLHVCLEHLDVDQESGCVTLEDAIQRLEAAAKTHPLSRMQESRLNLARKYLAEGKPRGKAFDQTWYSWRVQADSIGGLLDGITKDTPFTWRKTEGTYVILPKNGSLLQFPVALNTRGLTVAQAVKKILEPQPGIGMMSVVSRLAREGCEYVSESNTPAPVLDLKNVTALDALCQVTARAVPRFTWQLAGWKDGRALSLMAGDWPWGAPASGVQARLSAVYAKYRSDIVPEFVADVRNLGRIDLSVAQAQQLCELQLDGVDYYWGGVSRVKSSDLPPGRQYEGIPITLVDTWHSNKGDVPLKLSAGKHILRVIFVVRPGDVTGAARPIRAVSNPVEIEIAELVVPPDTAPE